MTEKSGTTLSKEQVKKIAQLARLDLTEQEVILYAEQLSAILGYIEQLKEVDTENTPITTQITGLTNVLREDVVVECSEPERLIALAPESEDNLVKVKGVFN